MDLSDDHAFATTTVQNANARPHRNRNRDSQKVEEIIHHSIILRSGATYWYFFVATPRLLVQYRQFKDPTEIGECLAWEVSSVNG